MEKTRGLSTGFLLSRPPKPPSRIHLMLPSMSPLMLNGCLKRSEGKNREPS